MRQQYQIGLTVLPGLAVSPSMPHHANVREHGAAGDGKQDDSTAFEKALASFPGRSASQALFGGVIFVPAGEYRLSRPLEIPEHVVLMGEHQTAAVLRGDEDVSPLVTATGDHVRVENLTLRAAGTALAWQGGQGATVTSVAVYAGRQGIVCEPDSVGSFSSVDISSSETAVTCDGCAAVSFFSLNTNAPAGLVLRKSGPVCVHGLHHTGKAPCLEALDGSRAAVIGGLADAASGQPAIVCDAASLVHVSAFSSPKRTVAIDDSGGETASVQRANVGLYTGQATVIPE